MPLSRVADTGFAAAAAYDVNRPSYPSESMQKFLEVLDIKDAAKAHVIDLAAGTGKFTEILASQPESFSITAVEPHKGMREQLTNKDLKNVKVVNGTAEDMSSIADESAAAIVAAQSFHWFSNMQALKEIYRVLQPTGVFGMIWNVDDHNAPKSWKAHAKWETTLKDILFELDDGEPRFRDEKWKQVFDEQNRSNPISIHTADPLFGLPIGEDSIETKVWMSKEAIWARFQTYSQVANLEGERLEDVKKRFWDAVNSADTVVDDQGNVAVHGKVFWAWTSKIPGEPLQKGGQPDQ